MGVGFNWRGPSSIHVHRAGVIRDPERRLRPGVDGGLRAASWLARSTI